MKSLKTIFISAATFLVLFALAVNMPAYLWSKNYWLSKFFPTFGALTYTTLDGTESVSDFPTLWNTTLASLDAEVFELSDWYGTTTATQITDLGTITTGTWNADAISVAYQGTGTTSPTTNQLMLGNGSSGFKVIGFGSSGQFLTSQGDGTAPSWTTSAINQSDDYNWTGHHIFSSLFATNASSTNATTTNLYVGTLDGVLKGVSGQVTTAVAGTDYATPPEYTFGQFSTTTTTSSNGDETYIYHGLGEAPKIVRIAAFTKTQSNITISNSFGTATSTTAESSSQCGGGTGPDACGSSSHIVSYTCNGSTSNLMQVTALDSTQITLTHSNANGTCGTATTYLQWEAYK